MKPIFAATWLLVACSTPESLDDGPWVLGEAVDVGAHVVSSGWRLDLGDMSAVPGRIELPLPSGEVIVLGAERTSHTAAGWTWSGSGDGVDGSLVSVEGVVSGNFRGPTVSWELRPQGQGHVLLEVEPGSYPLEADPIDRVAPLSGEYAPVGHRAAEIVDLLIAYTDVAARGAGGTDNLISTMNLALLEANEGFARSNVGVQLRAVGYEPVAYDEDDLDLFEVVPRLKHPSDGFMDDVHDLRDILGADHVLLVVEHEDLEYCGLSYIMDELDDDFADWAFSSVARVCAAGNLSAAHELGHALGSVHEHDAESGEGVFPWSHGFVSPNQDWRTVMAIGGGVPRINRWSNPDQRTNFAPMGVDGDGQGAANNSSSISAVAQLAAAYRSTVIRGPQILAPEQGTVLPDDSFHLVWEDAGGDETVVTVGTALGTDDLAREELESGASDTWVDGLPHDGTLVYVRLLTRFGTVWESTDVAYRSGGAEPDSLPPEAEPAVLTSPDPGEGVWVSGAPMSWTDTDAASYRVQGVAPDGEVLWDTTTSESTVPFPSGAAGAVSVRLLTQSGAHWYGRSYAFQIVD